MHYDVVIVGAGPAGLAAAIRLKSLNPEISVVVVEKGSTVGAHILSGAVIDPIGLDQLTPEWRSNPECPLKTQVAIDQFYYLTETRAAPLPNWAMPKLMGNHGNFIGSLGAIARWLGARAEALGVEIYPGFAATELLYGDKGEVVGIATGDMGVDREGRPKPGIHARDGASRQICAPRGGGAWLAVETGNRPLHSFRQRASEVRNRSQRTVASLRGPIFAGACWHTFGWPLSKGASGGSFLYHYGDRLVSVGFVVHLNYENPTLSPFDEFFERFKTHPLIRGTFAGGRRIAYGARVIASGGWQSTPEFVFREAL